MTTIRQQSQAPTSGILCRTISRALLTTAALFSLLLASAGAQTFTVLHTFHGRGDGKYPYAAVLRDGAGNLYGTTGSGGAFDYGTVFKINAASKEKILHSFWGGDGLYSWSSLVRDQAGNLYGTTYDGGTREKGQCQHGCGAVFKLDTLGKLTVLHAFTGGTDGGEPRADLVRDQAGNLYGTASGGGDPRCNRGCGLVFKLDKDGNETVLHAFGSRSDGETPWGDLIRDKAGNLYGATIGGGLDWGTLFEVDSTGKETVLYRFPGSGGAYPIGPLVRDAEGNLYGTATDGGDPSCGCGVVSKIDTTGHETVLHAFTGKADGAYPYSGLTQDKVGNLYGTTWAGGGSNGCYSEGCGTVFKVDTNGNESVLHAFTGPSDGAEPFAPLIVDKSGNLYGTAASGGDLTCGYGSGCGVIFKLTP